MAITLRKVGNTPTKVSPVPTAAAGDEYKSPFRESFHAEDQETLVSPSAVPVDPAGPSAHAAPSAHSAPKPRAVFKITPGKSVKPGLPTASPPDGVTTAAQTTALVEAGLAKELTSADLYPYVGPGEFVRITNSLFPWVKHYKPGDIARVSYSSPTHSHPDDPIKYRAYFLEIVDGPRRGQKAFLFRWEFEPRDGCLPTPKIEGRVITQT
jgi:hypothetical protein